MRRDSRRPAAAPRPSPARQVPSAVLVGFALACLSLVAFLPACGNGFVEFDDQIYVTANPRVQAGLGGGVGWALTDTRIAAWHPLAWWSLQLDADLYGLDPTGFHFTSVALHAAAVVLLFSAVRLMTGALWPAAAVAAVFAVHPLRVESVAWVAERKDVLATVGWMAALVAYARYVRRPGVGRYLAVAAALAVGLLAKPTLVTLPFVLLLLDYWPLGRLDRGTAWRRVAEKLPLLALVAAGCAVTVAAQKPVIGRAEEFPLDVRAANALTSYARYLGMFVWPDSLAAFYPHPRQGLLAAGPLAASALLVAVTAAAAWQARRRPYLLVGWLWYLGTLVPMIGLVQVGGHGMADRYTYIPLVGVTLALVWWLRDLAGRSPAWAGAVRIGGPVLVVVLVALTWEQVGHWADTVRLWRRALEVTANNYEAHRNLAVEWERRGEWADAERHFEAALRDYPDKRVVHNDLGAHWMKRQDVRRAEGHFRAALALGADDPQTHNNLGGALVVAGKPAEAKPHLVVAVAGRPDDAGARFNLALACAALGEWAEAADHFAAGDRLAPNNGPAYHAFGVALRDHGRPALRHLELAVALRPDDPAAHADLGLALELDRQWPRATHHHREAVRLGPRVPPYRCGLAHALYGAGDRPSAAALYREAGRLDPAWPARAEERAWRLAVHPEAAHRNAVVAVHLAEQACQATEYGNPEFLDTLAAAYAEAGRFAEAVEAARKAIDKAGPELATQARERLRLYETGRPFRAVVTDAPPKR